METNKIAYEISKLTTEELDELNVVLRNKYGYNSNIYKYPMGIINLSNDNISYHVQLSNTGSQKLIVLKRIKELFGLGLREAKDIIDSAPIMLIENVSLEQAENIKYELEELGAVVDII